MTLQQTIKQEWWVIILFGFMGSVLVWGMYNIVMDKIYYQPLRIQHEQEIAQTNCHDKDFFSINFNYCKQYGVEQP